MLVRSPRILSSSHLRQPPKSPPTTLRVFHRHRHYSNKSESPQIPCAFSPRFRFHIGARGWPPFVTKRTTGVILALRTSVSSFQRVSKTPITASFLPSPFVPSQVSNSISSILSSDKALLDREVRRRAARFTQSISLSLSSVQTDSTQTLTVRSVTVNKQTAHHHIKTRFSLEPEQVGSVGRSFFSLSGLSEHDFGDNKTEAKTTQRQTPPFADQYPARTTQSLLFPIDFFFSSSPSCSNSDERRLQPVVVSRSNDLFDAKPSEFTTTYTRPERAPEKLDRALGTTGRRHSTERIPESDWACAMIDAVRTIAIAPSLS